jgi:transposase
MSWLDDLRDRLAREKALTPERVVEIIAAEYGGERLYIPRRTRPEILPCDTPATIQARHGVSRSTAYSWVRIWRR